MSWLRRFSQLPTLLVGCALLLPTYSFAQLSFQPRQVVPSTANSSLDTFADFNGDGRADLVTTEYSSSTGTATYYLYLSNADGTYDSPVTLPATVDAIGDFNGDGKLDFASYHTGPLYIYLGNGDGTFQSPKPIDNFINGNSMSAAIATMDLNHDGKTDIVVGGEASGNYMQVWLSNGDGTFTKSQTISVAYSVPPNGIVTGDFDGDGKADVALVNSGMQPTSIQVWYGEGNGQLGSPYIVSDPNNDEDGNVTVADINNDGRSDIIASPSTVQGRYTVPLPNLSVFSGNANRTLSFSTIQTSQCAAGTAVADFNGDGINDIAYNEESCSSPTSSSELVMKLGQGAGAFGAEQMLYQNLVTPMAIRTTTGTKPDLIGDESTGGGSTPIVLLSNTSAGAFPGCGFDGGAVGLSICTPGASASSPVQFSIGAAGPTPMRTVAVWADGKKVAEQLTHAFSDYSFLDASAPLAAGKHAITVYGTGWDNTLQQKSFTLNVAPSSTCSVPSSAGVHVCSPASGSTNSSPLSIQAASTVTGTLARMEVWVDGVKKYTSTTNMLNTSLTLAVGSHRFDFYAVNTAGQKWETTVYASISATIGSGCSAPSSAGVHVCSPASGSTNSSPLSVQAASTVTGTLARMEVWVDGAKKYTSTTTSLNTSIPLATGTHRFDFYAVNTAGTKWETTVNSTVK